MHYLYRHIRLDKNEPFYIGIGTKQHNKNNSFKSEYRRAFSKQRKDSKIWNLISNKTDYCVEILMDSDNYDFIKSKEKEFIKLYGRINNNTGCLANMTDGGDGSVGYVHSIESIEKLKIARKTRGFVHSCEIYQYDLQGNFIKKWESIKSASEFCKVHITTLHKVVKNNTNNNYCKGYYWKSNFEKTITPKEYKIVNRNAVIQMICPDTNLILKVFNSKKEASDFLGKKKISGFLKKCIDNNKKGHGYYWKEVNHE
jgi:hypothetical protein